MDELIDIVNKKGQATGNVCLKSFAHNNGILHASVHIIIYKDTQILLQKRSSNKDIYPNLWDISVAGHIASGEKPDIAAVREVEEEIGLSTTPNNLNYKGIWEEKHQHSNGMIDHEIHHIYFLETTKSINDFTLQDEEVSDLKFTPFNTFKKIIENTNTVVPHDPDYYYYILQLLNSATNEK